ncbi:MAG: DUF294 nucleotidyltransferase-like domain-containing protein, partial [Planctomycetota bacterium]
MKRGRAGRSRSDANRRRGTPKAAAIRRQCDKRLGMTSDDQGQDAVVAARRELRESRARVLELHRRGLDARQVCGRLTSLVDVMVGRLFEAALQKLHDEQADALQGNVAFVALGSYGRRQLAPFSDVDLMILKGRCKEEDIEALAQTFLTSMYDLGLQLGQSVRTPAQAVGRARTDAIICSSMIDGRLAAGNQRLFEDFRDQFKKMTSRRSKSLARAFHEARAQERRQYGESVYLLEPNVKRSRGALRDLNLLRWLGFVEHGESDPDRLLLLGAVSKFEHHRLASAQDYLLRLRNELHFHAGSARESLDRAEQLRIAKVYGHRHRAGLLPVEHFMRDYFRHTGFVWQIVRRREASLDVASSTLTKMLDPVFGRKVEGDYHVGVRDIAATPSGLVKLRGNLAEVLRLVEMASRKSKSLDQATWSALLLAAPDCPAEVDRDVCRRFLDILAEPASVGSSLRTLHELGYLEKVVPAMQHARCLLQFNQYH